MANIYDTNTNIDFTNKNSFDNLSLFGVFNENNVISNFTKDLENSSLVPGEILFNLVIIYLLFNTSPLMYKKYNN